MITNAPTVKCDLCQEVIVAEGKYTTDSEGFTLYVDPAYPRALSEGVNRGDKLQRDTAEICGECFKAIKHSIL